MRLPAVEARSLPVMLLDTGGHVLFMTSAARSFAAAWNAALDRSMTTLRIPEIAAQIFEFPRNDQVNEGRGAAVIVHPRLQKLSALIERNHSGSRGPYLLMFEEVASHAPQVRELMARLTPAERRVALLVAEGFGNSDIAAILQRSRRTVEYQLNAVFRKLDLTRRAQLIRALA